MDNLPKSSVNFKVLSIKSFIALLIVVIATFFFFFIKSQSTSGKLALPQIAFANSPSGERFEQLVKLGLESNTKEERFDNLFKAFSMLSADYSFAPNATKRTALEILSVYIRENFQEESKSVDLTVPCKESECGAVANYSEELSSLKNDINSSSSFDEQTKSTLFLNIENSAYAAGSGDSRGQFYSLSTLFVNLRTEWQRNSDPETKSLAEKVLMLMKEVEPEFFRTGSERGYYNLE